jgi:flagellar protein FlaG
MRIAGTDASVMALDRAQDTVTVSKADRVGAGTKQNISQLTEFEKKFLHVSEKVLINAIEKANKAIAGNNRRFEYSVHEKTNEIMVKVIDTDTDEVVREIPPEKILNLYASLMEMAGLIVDERR